MTNFKHLTKSELSAYSLGSLEKRESQRLGSHLLTCAECRKLLPMPSVERFWSVVMTDAEITSSPKRDETENFLTSLSTFLKLNYGFAWGGAALIIILSFSFLFWSGSADTSIEVVQTYDNELSSERNFSLPAQTPMKDNSMSSTNSNRAVVVPAPKILKLDSQKPKIAQNNSIQDFNKPNLKKQKQNISATRGLSSKCGENKIIEVEFSSNKENLVFKWKAVPKATKYHLYISDDEEILIDEFETEAQTSFVLKKPLDPLKTYKWKIIVTLENGNTVVGDSQKFTMRDFQINQKKIEKKRTPDTRCSADG